MNGRIGRSGCRRAGAVLAWSLVLGLAGCDTFLNQTASRGGDVAGEQGNLYVAFLNKTPYRAVFTYGTYNNTSELAQPAARQFTARVGAVTLEADSNSDIVTLPCDRVFSIGDPELLRLIEENSQDDTLVSEALHEGVAFSDAALGEADAATATEGYAPPLRALLGVDFPCGSLLIIRFEVDDAGDAPFRIDFELFPPRDDDRGL